MSDMNIIKKFSSLNRLRYILTVIFKSGGGLWLERLNLKYLVSWRCRIMCFFRRKKKNECLIHKDNGELVVKEKVLRKVLEELGPTFIKLGQVLSLRADIVGEKISQELTKLQSGVSTFPYEQVRGIIKDELGDYPEKIFKSFSKKAIAGASLAQVHSAVLKDGTKVAVKVQRPDVKKTIEQDINIFFYIAHLIEKHIPEYRIYKPYQLVKEFAEWTMSELDFRTEGHSADHFRAMFEDTRFINIPSIYWEYSNSRVLTMDFMDGLHSDDIKGMRKLGINQKNIATQGVKAMFRQFLIEGFFHADPHPGNFFALKGGILCLHDFGMVGYLSVDQRRELLSCFVAFVNKDIDNFQKHFLHLAKTDVKSEIEGFKKDIAQALDEFFYSPTQPSIAWSFFRMVNSGTLRGVYFPTDLILFAKAMVTTESMGKILYPQFDFNKQFQPFVKKAYKAYLNPKKIMNNLESDIFDYINTIKTLPERTLELMKKIDQGNLGVKIDTAEILGIKEEFDRQNSIRVLGIIITAVLIVTGILFHLEGKTIFFGFPLSNIFFGVSIVLSIWFFVKLRQRPIE